MRQLVVSLVGLLLLSTPIYVSAQRNTVTGAMIIHNTDVIKSKRVKKQLTAADIKKGYQQETSLAYSVMFDTGHMINLNYVGGYRFNHHFYVGVGTGLDFSTRNYNAFICYSHIQGDCYNYIRYYEIRNLSSAQREIGKRYLGDEDDYWWHMPMQTVAVPLYIHLRTYFMKTKWTPFIAFSAGARFSSAKKLDVYNGRNYGSSSYDVGDFVRTIKYGAVTGMFEVMPGVAYQHKSGTAFNFQFGFATRSGGYHPNYAYDYEEEYDSDGLSHEWAPGITVRFGVVF
jgi:hypothetical protein